MLIDLGASVNPRDKQYVAQGTHFLLKGGLWMLTCLTCLHLEGCKLIGKAEVPELYFFSKGVLAPMQGCSLIAC